MNDLLQAVFLVQPNTAAVFGLKVSFQALDAQFECSAFSNAAARKEYGFI